MPGVRRKGIGKLPELPKVPSVSALLPKVLPAGTVRGKRGSVVDVPLTQQPTREDYDRSGWAQRYAISSMLEYLTDWALRKLRYTPGTDYVFQKAALGGIDGYTIGGTQIDFVFLANWPWIALPVQGEYFHDNAAQDVAQFNRLSAEEGYIVIPLDGEDLERDAYNTVRLAVREQRNISRYAGLM